MRQLIASHGKLPVGRGLVSGVFALALALLCVLGVAAFHFPEYLTTPELRRKYDVDLIRQLMYWSMVVAGALSLWNIVLGRTRWLSSTAFALVGIALLLGGHRIEVGDFPDGTPYIGLDWFILDLLGSTLIFVFVEKLFPLREQAVFRPGWQTDLQHFVVNHLAVGFVLLATNLAVHTLFGWAASDGIRGAVQALPFALALFLIVLAADLVQYAAHRAYHEVPALWRLHAVHHSAKTMDWLAGSRQHILELLLTRTLVLGAIFLAGFDKAVIDAYIVIVGVQAVFNHANVSARLGPLRFLIVTPNFHHWHHSQDKEALDRNYAAHFAFIDYLFGTAARADRMWPRRYGVLGDYVPEGFVRQLAFPFSTVASVPAAVDAKPAMTLQPAPPSAPRSVPRSASQRREPNRAPGS